MTKKDFQLIADVLRRLRDDLDHLGEDDHKYITDAFANALDRTNDRFDRDRFIAATIQP